MDGLTGESLAVQAVFPQTLIQRCREHQIRNSLKYVVYKDQDDMMRDLKKVYKAPTLQVAEDALTTLSQKWSDKYGVAVNAWQNIWPELATFFEFPFEIRRLIYTNNAIESYNRQLRKVTKNKGGFPSEDAIRKLLFLAHRIYTRRPRT